MMIIGCDYHPGFQQIAFVDTETGELQERRLGHREEAEKFYRDLGAPGVGGGNRRSGSWQFSKKYARCRSKTMDSLTSLLSLIVWRTSSVASMDRR
jgi:hypothetical protein